MLEFNRRDIKAMIMGPKPPKGPEGKNVLWMDTHSAVPLLRVWLNERWTAVENTDSETIHIDFEGVKADVRELQSYFRPNRSIVVTNVDCRGGLLKLGDTELLESELITFLGFDDRITALEQEGAGGYTAGDNITIEDGVISAIDTTYSNATEETSGLMSYQDKIKLNGLNNYVLPTASASVLGGIKVGDTLTIDANGVLNALSSVSIDDTTISTTKTWSSNKINSELSGKQATLTAGQNIVITNNTISAVVDAGFDVEVVQALPTTGEVNTIYFVPASGGTAPNVYDEYMYINNSWEVIGTTQVDLSNYYNKTETDNLLAGKQGTLTAGSNISINNNTISATDTTYSAGANIAITNNIIKAEGYIYNTTTGAFAEGDRDIDDSGATRTKPSATGVMSHAEGINTIAYGRSSHAEGTTCSAIGIQSHAEGFNTNSIGVNSHAEGRQAVTNGYASHAEGDGAETGGNYASATSNPKTVDSRVQSAGDYSHAEGLATIAYGYGSHAEGSLTFAKGNYSHAEGMQTNAISHASHTEGQLSTSNGTRSHAEGYFTETGGNYASATNNPKTPASNIDAGAYAHAEGNACIAYGNSSHAEGKLTFAKGTNSHAEGHLTVANGDTSHAEGYTSETGGNYTSNTKTAGGATDAGAYSHAEGNATIANGIAAHSEGKLTFAKGNNSHTEGNGTRAQGAQSHAEGGLTTVAAAGANGHSEGRATTANGYASHAEGDTCETGGNYSSNTTNPKTPNSRTTTAGDYSHAEGNATIAYGVAAHSEGKLTLAKGNNSHAEGGNTIANGTNSHAEGQNTQALGGNSHSEGGLTIATGGNAHTEGRYTQALNAAEHAQGSYNKSHTDDTADGFGTNGSRTIHSIGIGTADNARKNAVEVMQNGDAYLLGVGNYDGVHIKGETGAPSGLQTLQETIRGKQDALTAGENIDITNNTISALGYEYNPSYSSITNGDGCSAEGWGSHAEGIVCVTGQDALGAHAEGVGTETNNINEHAQGRYNVSHSVSVSETHHEGNTVVSVGIGEDGERKNAFEIMQNGDIYVYGVGNYDGTATKYDNPDVMTLQDILKKIADAAGVDIGALI